MSEKFRLFRKKEKPKTRTEDDIRREQVVALEKPAQILLEKLRKDIDAGAIGTIVGVDASGRLPALVMGKVLKRIYAERGFPGPEIRFAPGKFSSLNSFKFNTLDKQRKVLVVDDTITTGHSMTSPMRVLDGFGFKVEGAAFWNAFPFILDETRTVLGTLPVHTGLSGDAATVTHRPLLSGVVKSPKTPYAQPLRKLEHYSTDVNAQKSISDARKVVSEISERLAVWYQNTSQNNLREVA